MRQVPILAAGLLVAALGTPTIAEDAMNSMGMMEGGEVMAFMPDGHMGKTMMTDQAMMDDMMKMATPIDGCLIIMTGKDGKTYMVKPTTKEEMAACEKMAM
jgi:hypothetical protein